MNALTDDQFQLLIGNAFIKPRFKRDLKYTASTEHLDGIWDEYEMQPIWNKSKQGGILLLQPKDSLYLVPFEVRKPAQNVSGRVKPIVCDLCFTWHSGGSGRYVTFYPSPKSDNTISFLCCGDLGCSNHIRGKTMVSTKSRAQLPEHMTTDERVARHRHKITALIAHLGLEPLHATSRLDHDDLRQGTEAISNII